MNNIDKTKAVAFTGHRQERITTDQDALFAELYRTISELYANGYTTTQVVFTVETTI